MKNILFVCTGNTCRSSMAEGFFKERLKADPELGAIYSVSSAGTFAYDGDPANPHSIRTLMEDWNIDIRNHRAKLLQKEDVDNAYLILTLTREHKNSILSRFPNAVNKIFTLKEYVYEGSAIPEQEKCDYAFDIIDPYGKAYETYKSCGGEIKKAVEKLAFKLKNESEG